MTGVQTCALPIWRREGAPVTSQEPPAPGPPKEGGGREGGRKGGREGGRDRQSETRQALLGEQSRTFESRHGHRHTSLGVRKEKKETLGPPRRENKTQPG